MDLITKLTYWYFSRRALPHWCVFLLDCIIVFFTGLLTYALFSGLSYTADNFLLVCGSVAAYLLFFIVGFRVMRTYAGVIRYSSFVDLQRVACATIIGFVLIVVASRYLGCNDVLAPIRVVAAALWTVVVTMIMWSVRVAVKYLYDTLYRQRSASKAFVYGIRQGGVGIAKSIRNQDPAKYILAGFLADDDELDSKMLMGVGVYKIDDEVVDVMKAHDVRVLFVSPLRGEALRDNPDFVTKLLAADIRIFMVPAEQEWDGKTPINHSQMREVVIEDLLPRDKIEVDLAAIADQLRGHRILITGAAGSIGSEIVRQVGQFEPSELVLIDQSETPLHDIRLMMARLFPNLKAPTIVADIANKSRMEYIFKEHRPEYVFHAAAYKHVPMMEDNPSESIRNNVEGTRIIADLAVKYGVVKFVMISTDKAVNPTNVMGCSKRICEIYVQSLDQAIKSGKIEGKTQFVTTRFGNVLGSNGSVIPLFKEQIKNGGPVTVTHPDIVRFFMLIPEACKLVLEAGTMGHGGEIFVFDMGEPVKIVDLAKRMIQLSGANIEIKFTGLRDGEKLYEEVLNDKELTLPTFHPKIKIAKVREYSYDEVNEEISDLCTISVGNEAMSVVRKMKSIVPEFKSQHSIYEQLD